MLGTFTPKIDEKGRLILPAKFRELLSDGLVLTRGQERCLYILTAHEFQRMYRKIQKSKSEHKRLYARLFTADAMSDRPDKQGRITITAGLRDYASLTPGEEVVVIGAGTRIEVWDKAAWETYQEQNLDIFATLSEEVF
jgi:MraZ protein